MQIPKGIDYTFSVKVLEEDSRNPQDLSNMTSAKFICMTRVDGVEVFNIDTANGDITTSAGRTTSVITETVVKDSYDIQQSYSKSQDIAATPDAQEGITSVSTTTSTYKTVTTTINDTRDAYGYTTYHHESSVVAATPLTEVGSSTEVSTVTNTDGNGEVTSTDTTTVITDTTLVSSEVVTETRETTSIFSGVLNCTIPQSKTDLLTITETDRGSKADGSYIKPTYKASMLITFSDRSDVTVIIDSVSVVEVGA